MLLKKSFLASVLALGLLSPAVLHAEGGEGGKPHAESENNPGLSVGKFTGKVDRGSNSESAAWRGRYGAYSNKANGGRKNNPYKNTAYDNQKASNENSKNFDLIGVKTKEYNKFESDPEKGKFAGGACGASYKALGYQAGGNIGISSTREKEENGEMGKAKKGLACMAGVEGTLISGKVECQKFLSGDKDGGVDVKGGAEGGAKANLSCKCNGGSVVCEAFIGLKGGVDGSIGGNLCGLRLAVGGGVEGGAGAGGKVQAGYVKGKGFGFSLSGYVGLGAGGSVYVDPQLAGLLEGKTYTCLADKAKGALAAIGKGLTDLFTRIGEQQIQAAQMGGGGVFLAP